MYKALYINKNGEMFCTNGTLAECANWANNVVLANGEGTIIIDKEKSND